MRTIFNELKCRAIRSELPDYVTRRLSTDENARIAAHLAECSRCAEVRHSLAQAVGVATDARDATLPESLTSWGELQAQIAAGERRAPVGPIWPKRLVFAGGAALACAAILWFAFKNTGDRSIGTAKHHEKAEQSVVRHEGIRPDVNSPRVIPHERSQQRVPQQAYVDREPQRSTVDDSLVRLRHQDLIGKNFKGGNQQALNSGRHTPAAAGDDLEYLNPDISNSLKPWTQRPADAIRDVELLMERHARGGDGFVSVPLPVIAGLGSAAVKSAIVEHDKEAAIVDARLVRPISLHVKGGAFSDLCETITKDTGIRLTANRRVADDKVTLLCHPRPLRDIMRLISQHFGFAWVRSGNEGEYEYELIQPLKSQLLEEGLKQKDEEDMLLAIDRSMEKYRKYRGISLKQLNAMKMNKDNLQEIFQLQMGGLAAVNQFFALSGRETEALRAGQTLSVDLLNQDGSVLPRTVTDGIWHSFDESYARERKYDEEHGTNSQLPDHPTRLTTSLQLDRGTPGQLTLKGNISDQRTGLSSHLAAAKSEAFHVENGKNNAKFASDPDLQNKISFKPEATSHLEKTSYPDTESLYQQAGPKVTTADVLEHLYAQTGLDIIGDYFSHLQSPGAVAVNDMSTFAALNQIGDRMLMRWTKIGSGMESWLQFRTGTYYYDRPQEIPNRLLERWKALRKRQGVMSPEDLCEVAQLPDAQLDSIWMSRSAIAVYGLEEWQMGRIAQIRPHWRFLGRLTDLQRKSVFSEKGLAYGELSPEAQSQFLALAYDGDLDRPGRQQIRRGNLRGYYVFATHPIGYGGSYAVLQSNPLVFVYAAGMEGQSDRLSIVGPWNGIYGYRPEMLKPDAFSIIPGR